MRRRRVAALAITTAGAVRRRGVAVLAITTAGAARRRGVAVLAIATATAALAAGCGEADDPPVARPAPAAAGAIVLTVRSDDGAGTTTRGRLECTAAAQRAEGDLDGRAPVARLCAHARTIKTLLTTQPPARRTCTQIYGGPETARVTGTIDSEKVDRRFSRTNGCEIADYQQASGLLSP